MRCSAMSLMKLMSALLLRKPMPMPPMRWKTSMLPESTGDIWPAFMPDGLFRQRLKEPKMKIEGKQIIKATRDRLWHLLTDPGVLSRCIPGCQSLEGQEDGTYKMVMKAGVGSIKGLFNGSIKLDEI